MTGISRGRERSFEDSGGGGEGVADLQFSPENAYCEYAAASLLDIVLD